MPSNDDVLSGPKGREDAIAALVNMAVTNTESAHDDKYTYNNIMYYNLNCIF